MKQIKSKLNSKRGVSLMLALLLFLVCTLAGAAAITAAGSNIGRHSYLREYQQQYLSVSSAAKLLKAQFEAGAKKITAEYTLNSGAILPEYKFNDLAAVPSESVYGSIWDDMQKLLNKKLKEDPAISAAAEWQTGLASLQTDYNTDITLSVEVMDTSNNPDDAFEKVDVTIKLGTDKIVVKLNCGDYKLEFDVELSFGTVIEDKKATITLNNASVNRITLPGKMEGV